MRRKFRKILTLIDAKYRICNSILQGPCIAIPFWGSSSEGTRRFGAASSRRCWFACTLRTSQVPTGLHHNAPMNRKEKMRRRQHFSKPIALQERPHLNFDFRCLIGIRRTWTAAWTVADEDEKKRFDFCNPSADTTCLVRTEQGR